MLAMICRMDKSGLGIQSRRLYRMLKPDRIMLIDSAPFNRNEQHPEWFKDTPSTLITGFPDTNDIINFCKDVDKVITCETFYNDNFVDIARRRGVKTIQIVNYEFWENLRNPFLEVADKIVMPSHWHLEEMQQNYRAIYLPTPIFEDEFAEARKVNLKREGRKYLFINGKTTHMDRQGLSSLYEAVQLAKGNFTITIKSQSEIKKHPDPRLIYDFSNPENANDMYKDYDLLIHPRRYAGQSLVMCEGLSAALPVIMTDVDPNNKVLPKEWLIPSMITGSFQARTQIDVHSAISTELAEMLDNIDLSKDAKLKAYEIGKQYDAESLRKEYEDLVK